MAQGTIRPRGSAAPPNQQNEPPPNQTPEARYTDPTYMGATSQPQGGFRDKWRDRPPEGYRVTPMGWRTLTEYEQPGPIRRRPDEIPDISYDQAIDQMPGSEFLTPSERWLYKKLPLVMDKTIAGRPVGDWLESFNDGWMGKVLGMMDVGAETLERGHGFLSQWSDAYLYGNEDTRNEFNQNLAEAWYAGGLFADMTNLPGFTRDDNGNISGMNIPGQLGGRNGINRARQRIAELTDRGLDPGDALKQVRAEYYTDLGALSIRAQMQDTYYHMLLDPINVLLPYLKPIERTQALRIIATSGKLLPGSVDGLVDTANALQDAAKIAEAAGDTANAAESIAAAERILARAESLRNTPEIGALDRFAIFITGGDPLEPTKLASKWNPFSLTPSARTNEMMTVVGNNIDNYILGKFDDPYQIVESIARAKNGSLGPEFGHAFLTLEGRSSQAVLSAAEAAAKQYLADYISVAPQMDIIQNLSRLTGETVYDVVNYFEGDNAAAFISRIGGMGDEGAELAAKMNDDFVNIVKKFNELDLPYTNDLFKWHLSESVRDATARLAIAKFGLKERGLVQKMTGALKSAETLAFLRMNPTFVVKNFINNESTILARGLGGLVRESDMARFIGELGFKPYRLRQAFTMAGEGMGDAAQSAAKVGRTFEDVVTDVGKAEQLIADTLRGDGFWTKVDDFIKKGGDKLPPGLDMGTYATRAERSASARAFYTGYTQGWNRYFWKPGKGYSRMNDVINPEVFGTMSRQSVDAIEQAIGSIKSEKELHAVTQADNLNLNARAIADDIVKEWGYDLQQRFDAAYIDKITEQISEAMPRGEAAVRRTVDNLRQEIFKKLDDAAEATHQARIDEVATITQMEGPQGLLRAWGDSLDDFHGGTIAYDANMARFSPEGLTGEIADVFWKQKKAEQAGYWTRQWNRIDETIEGMKKGAKNLLDSNGKPMQIPAKVTDGFKGWRNGWESFYKLRNKLQDTFFAEILEGKTPTRQWADIQTEINESYLKMVTSEADFTTAIDDAMTQMVRQSRPDVSDAFSAWRQHARELRFKDRQDLAAFRDSLKGLSPDAKNKAWQGYWKGRQEPHVQLWRTDRAALAALQGDPKSAAALTKLNEVNGASAATDIRTIANRYGIPTATKDGVPLDRRVVDTVNKYLRGEYNNARNIPSGFDSVDEYLAFVNKNHAGFMGREVENIDDIPEVVFRSTWDESYQFTRLDEIPPDVAEEAFEARRVFNGEPELPPVPEKTVQQFDGLLVDSDQVLKEYRAMNPPTDVAEDQHWLANGFNGLDDIEAKAVERINRPPIKYSDLSAEQTAEVEKYLRHVEGQVADARMASIKFGEFRRDSALLNYNRRYNYNEWLSAVMPFEFWTTQSLAKWALHSIDRPAMLSSYLRMRKFMATAGMPGNGFPSRLKDSVRIELPFLPDFMGKEMWVDPLRWALPFDNFASAYDQWRNDSTTENGRAERLLLDMVKNGQANQQEAQQAIADRQGTLWDQAIAQARLNDSEGRNDAWDYANLLLSPHAPITWAKEALIDGTPENIGPFLPISRTIKQAFGVLGIETSNSKYNVGGKIRQAMGLPAFDKWDDYRIDRELSNMAAEGYSVDEIKRAMIERSGPLWNEANSRAAKGFAGGGAIPFILKTLGIPTQSYPEGEQAQRALQDDFSRAYEAYDNGDVKALTEFFDQYPEYETRLALWKTPEERLQSFLVDNIWSQYNELPVLSKRQLREALGPDFQQYFLDRETRNYEAIQPEVMQGWLKLMGGDPPGSLNSPTQPLELANSEQSWRVEQFYNLRGALFPRYNEQQDEYFKLDDDAKKKYRYDHPELTSYWDWRRDFFHRNPDVVPYLDDDFEFKYPSVEAVNAAQSGMPQYSFEEWSYVVGSRSTARVLQSGDIPAGAESYLEELADELGITLEEMIELVGNAQ